MELIVKENPLKTRNNNHLPINIRNVIVITRSKKPVIFIVKNRFNCFIGQGQSPYVI